MYIAYHETLLFRDERIPMECSVAHNNISTVITKKKTVLHRLPLGIREKGDGDLVLTLQGMDLYKPGTGLAGI